LYAACVNPQGGREIAEYRYSRCGASLLTLPFAA
jgi:hypothetical protein